MPKKAKELTATAVKNLKNTGFYAVGGVSGLHLQITNENAKSWILRATVGIRRRDIGLGSYDEVSLKEAREIAREHRRNIRKGKDPIAEKKAAREALLAQAAKVMTFDEATKRYLDVKLMEFKNPKHRQQWQNTLATYASPFIGKMQVAEIETPHVQKVLEPIWKTKTETAKRLQGRIEKVIDWAITSGYRKNDNPSR